MSARTLPAEGPTLGRSARCRCGHWPTHHMVVVPAEAALGFRLDPSGPCALCGESTCRRYSPGAG